MISAKDEFFLEREHINEINFLIQKSDLSHEEIEGIEFDGMTIEDFEQLKKTLSDREISPLERVKRGQTVSQYQINKAVKRAANDL